MENLTDLGYILSTPWVLSNKRNHFLKRTSRWYNHLHKFHSLDFFIRLIQTHKYEENKRNTYRNFVVIVSWIFFFILLKGNYYRKHEDNIRMKVCIHAVAKAGTKGQTNPLHFLIHQEFCWWIYCEFQNKRAFSAFLAFLTLFIRILFYRCWIDVIKHEQNATNLSIFHVNYYEIYLNT